jgi:hypothetical protein
MSENANKARWIGMLIGLAVLIGALLLRRLL